MVSQGTNEQEHPMLLLLFLLSPMMGVAAATTLLFWYEEINSPPPLSSPLHSLPVLLLRCFVSSFAGATMVVLTYPLGLLRQPIRGAVQHTANPAHGYPPVLLVHGLYHNRSAWLALRRHLHAAGFEHLHDYSYSSAGPDFHALVSRLDAEVRAVQAMHPGRCPLLVGHSLGGLIIRRWLSLPGNALRATGVLTLGTPHQGSRLALLGPGALAHSLAYRGELVRQLEAAEIVPSIPCTAIHSPADNMVLPQEGLMVRVAGWKQIEGPAVSHVWMLWNRATARRVVQELRQMAG